VSWVLLDNIAEAALVQVVRSNQSGEEWITVLGDLETPESTELRRKQNVTEAERSVMPLAPVGMAIGRWEKQNFGPIFADVRFFGAFKDDFSLLFEVPGEPSISDRSIFSRSGDEGDFVGGQGNPFQMAGFFSGTLSGSIGGSVDIVLNGTLEPVPLPSVGWLFATGLLGLAWFALGVHSMSS